MKAGRINKEKSSRLCKSPDGSVPQNRNTTCLPLPDKFEKFSSPLSYLSSLCIYVSQASSLQVCGQSPRYSIFWVNSIKYFMRFHRGYAFVITLHLSDFLCLLKLGLHKLRSQNSLFLVFTCVCVLRCVCVITKIAFRWKINIFHAGS